MKKIILVLFVLVWPVQSLWAQAPAAKVLVNTIIEQPSAEHTAMQGVLYFDKVSGLSTEVDGLVKRINFSKGDVVKAGDILVGLNTEFIDKDIHVKRTEIQGLDIRIEHCKKNLNRYEKLFDQDAASETDYEDLSYSHRQLVKERAALKVSLAKIMLKKEKSIIRAPFDGIILEKDVDLGAWISHGNAFCKIGSTHDLFVNVPVNEKLLKFIVPGNSMDIVINAYEKRILGRIQGILPQADKKTKSVSLKVRLPEQKMTVANMSATAYVPTSMERLLKRVPRDALVSMGQKNHIYTIMDNKAKRLPINILFFKGEYAYSDSPDLFPGMVVVVDGNQRLSNNQAVSITGEHL